MIEFQRLIMADRVRNGAFHRALNVAVKPGMTVVDIGSGTGFLSFLARKLGARECHLYEVSGLLDLSKEIARRNGITGCHFIRKHSTQVRNPPQADVVISETLGNYALEENIVETLRDGRRFLKPGGVMIPRGLTQTLCPVANDRLYREFASWDDVGYDIDFSAARDVSMQNMYVKTVHPEDLLPDGARVWDTVDFLAKESSVRSGMVEWEIKKPVTIYGCAAWWDAELVPGVTLSTSPSAEPTHWQQNVFPLLAPMRLAAGERFRFRIHSDSRYDVRIRVRWEAERLDAAGALIERLSMDMRKGSIA